MTSFTEDELIPISALQHYVYCPRQCALIHVEQAFEDNVYTQRGNILHENVDKYGVNENSDTKVVRAMSLFSYSYGLAGRADVVEFKSAELVYPVEYKTGNQKGKLHDRIQLTAQAFCLEEMFKIKINEGFIFWDGTKKREKVIISSELRNKTEEIIVAVRQMINNYCVPLPIYDKKCSKCSLFNICQPELISNINGHKSI
jgi:CRISPR-associated exonuclease Cas4